MVRPLLSRCLNEIKDGILGWISQVRVKLTQICEIINSLAFNPWVALFLVFLLLLFFFFPCELLQELFQDSLNHFTGPWSTASWLTLYSWLPLYTNPDLHWLPGSPRLLLRLSSCTWKPFVTRISFSPLEDDKVSLVLGHFPCLGPQHRASGPSLGPGISAANHKESSGASSTSIERENHREWTVIL